MFQKKTFFFFLNHNINFTENIQDAGCPGQLVYCIPLLRTVGLASLRYFRYFLMYFRYFPIQTTKATNLLDEIKWQMDIFFQGVVQLWRNEPPSLLKTGNEGSPRCGSTEHITPTFRFTAL